MNGHLASVQSEGEDFAVSYAGGCNSSWIGLVVTKTDGTVFKWWDGKPLNYTRNVISNPYADGVDRYQDNTMVWHLEFSLYD